MVGVSMGLTHFLNPPGQDREATGFKSENYRPNQKFEISDTFPTSPTSPGEGGCSCPDVVLEVSS